MTTPKQAAIALNGDVSGQHISCAGPGHSPHDKSLSVTLDPAAPDGFLVHSFAGDDWQDCRDYVKDRLGIGRTNYTPTPRPERPCRVTDDADRIRAAWAIWGQTRPLTGTLADTYLKGRGCLVDCLPDDLRYHSELRYQGGIMPGLVAAMRDIRTNEIKGIHRTFLKPDAAKLDRKMLGIAKGSVVKLTPDANVTYGLGLSEGIETGLAIMRAGFSPVWACLSAGAIAAFPVLPGIESLTVFADHDASHTGQNAAARCVRRWRDAGQEARAVMPITRGDFNDV